jgi:hypothetical protein
MSTHHSSGILHLKFISLLFLILIAILGSVVFGNDRERVSIFTAENEGNFNLSGIPSSTPVSSNKAAYNCRFEILIVEPISYRYWDYYNQGYQYGFLDFALLEELHIQESHSGTVIWDGDESPGAEGGFSDLEESNIMAIAVIYNNDTYHEAYSDPGDPGPPAYPFNAYYVDAAAGATPGTHGSSVAINGTTHTSFIHESTANF